MDILIFASHMNFERYIASRIGASGEGTFSRVIIKIAIAAIALSMMVMIISVNVITGFKNGVSDKVFSFWGHIHITDGLANDSFELIPVTKDSTLLDSISNIRQISYIRPRSITDYDNQPPMQHSAGGVSHVDPYVVVPSIVQYKTEYEGLLLKGLDPTYDTERIESFIEEGSFITFPDTIPSRDILISQHTADRMNFNIGQKVNVNFILDSAPRKRQFTISGIYKTGLEEYDRRFGLVDIRLLQQLLGWGSDEVSGLEIFVDDLDDIELINDFIYFELLPPATYSESVRTKFSQIFEWLELQNVNERVINILMLVVALFNMVTALLIFVLERTRMIGVLKSLGATDWSVRKIFMYCSAQVILKGIIIGNIVAIGLCFIQKYTGVLKLREADYYLSEVPIEFNIPSMILINITTVVVVLLFMLIPSLIISQITPVKTIQFN